MADGSYRLTRLKEAANEVDGVLVQPQEVRVRNAPRQHEAIVLGDGRLRDRLVLREGVGPIEMVEGLDLTRLRGEKLGRGPGVLYGLSRLRQLDLLGVLRSDEESYLASL